MAKEIWVAGYPSLLGGADSELLHNIDLWRMHDVEVHLVPMFGRNQDMKDKMDSIGCITHDSYSPSIFKDKVLVSFCNGTFLSELPKIIEAGRPRKTVWFNCMTWTFGNEVVAHQNGWIDLHGFVSNYQKGWLKPELEKHNPVVEFEGYRPYFNPDNATQQIEFKYREHGPWFGVGRISRDDGAKFSSDMWHMFNKVCVPRHKKVFILGYGANAHQKCGPAPKELDWQTWLPNQIPVKQVFNLLNCMIHKTGGSRESYCRVLVEAYAYGVPAIVEDDYAFPDLVVDGVTGYRCKTTDEMAYRASELAFDEEKRKKMIFAAHDFLLNEIASKEKCWEPWRKLLEE